MKIRIHEITDQESEFDFDQSTSWLLEAVEHVDEKLETEPVRKRPESPRPIRAHFNLRKVDDVVVVSGSIDTHVNLICSRCAASFNYPAQPAFSALFCKDPVMAGVGHLEGEGKPAGQTSGFARHAHDFGSEDGENSGETGRDLDITYLAGDTIDLGEVLTEQLRLLLPFQPLCDENCKGMCTHCGADLNVGRCACAKIARSAPFSVLQDLKTNRSL